MVSQNRWMKLPSGMSAMVANYKLHGLPEYDCNPLIQALPKILDDDEFIEKVQRYPHNTADDRNLSSTLRYHCVERLTASIPYGYFQPLNRHIELHRTVIIAIMQGYVARNIAKPVHAIRASQIHQALVQADGNNLGEYLMGDTSAQSITLIGPSGCGKTTALLRVLNLIPKIIFHPDHNFFQIPYIKVDCPHSGSLKDLCIKIFLYVDKLFGTTDYYTKFGSKSNSEGHMLAQVAAIMNNHGVGALIIDELQYLTAVKKELPERMLNYFVSMVNCLGVPVMRVGTNKAVQLLNKGLKHARRAGGIFWNLMQKNAEWEFFCEGLFEAQWTKTPIPFSSEISNTLFDESQGIADIAIKLHKMVQWRAISLGGNEIITSDLIHEVAADGLILVKPMLDAIRSGDPSWMEKYDDISPVDTEEYYQKWLSKINSIKIAELRKQAQQKQKGTDSASATLSYIILELLNLGVERSLAKICAEKIFAADTGNTDPSIMADAAYKLALEGLLSNQAKTISKRIKLQPVHQPGDMRQAIDEGKEKGLPEFEALEALGVFIDPVQKFLR